MANNRKPHEYLNTNLKNPLVEISTKQELLLDISVLICYNYTIRFDDFRAVI